MEYSVVARMGIWAIHWYRVHLHHKNATLTAIVTKKAYSVPINVDRLRTVPVVRLVQEEDAEQSVIQDLVLLVNYARTEHAWQVAREIRTVLAIDHALTASVWIRALEERLAVEMPSVRWQIIKHFACVPMDSKVIHEKAVYNTNAKRTRTVNWIRSVS